MVVVGDDLAFRRRVRPRPDARGVGRRDRLFNGRGLVEPALVLVPHWRSEAAPGPDADQAWTYGGVASA